MKRRVNRHVFRFTRTAADGREIAVASPAKVKFAKKPVALPIKMNHLFESLQANGQGTTQFCVGGIGCMREQNIFPHPVDSSGYVVVQFTDTRAWVVSKTKEGLPVECYSYTHHDNVARLFDTKAGLERLRKDLLKNGDPRVVMLYPTKPKTHTYKPRVRGTYDGSKTRVLRGAALRHARTQNDRLKETN